MVSGAARIPAFVIPLLIAATFGAGSETDAYFIAYSAVLFLGGTFAQGLEQAIVPFAARVIHQSNLSARNYFDRAARNSAVVAAAAWAVGMPLLALATAQSMRPRVLLYSICFVPMALTWCAAGVFGGALVSQWRIATSTGSMLWRGVGALVGLVLVPTGAGLWAVAAGLGLGEFARVLWLRSQLWKVIPSASGMGVGSLRSLSAAVGAQTAATVAIGVAPVVERLLAISLGAGSVSHLEYAIRLLVIPGVLFEGALAPLLLARLTHPFSGPLTFILYH